MVLGTSDRLASLALAIVPPGNLVRELSALRASVFRERGEPSARAYFDFPVIAWLREPPGGDRLAAAAGTLRRPVAFGGWRLAGSDLFLELAPELGPACLAAMEANGIPGADGTDGDLPAGPFAAGIGLYCASLQEPVAPRAPAPAIRADTWLLAAIELSWTPGTDRSSSWAVLASARAGTKGGNRVPSS